MTLLLPSVAAELDDLGLDYEVLDCDPALADTAAFCEAYDIPPERSANAILIASKRPPGQFAVCVALATTRLDVNHRVKELMGVKKLSFAGPEATVEQTGMEIGGVTPFGIDVPVYIDAAVLDQEWVVLGGGNRSSKLKLDPRQLDGLAGIDVVEGLASPVQA